jgi:peptidoglycan/LPS O-acetylase OafA/YrhL
VLGKLSYPLYILQQPFNDLLADYVHREHPGLNLRIELALALITTLILVALAMGRWYDEPLRRWLNRRLLSPRSPDQSPIAAPSRGSVTTFS